MAPRDNYEFFETLAAGGGGGGAPTNASYVVIALNGTLTAERVLTAGSGISITDGGAGGNVTIAATASGGGTTGTTTVNFGAFPGSSHASASIAAASVTASTIVEAWIFPAATADHTADEHKVETIRVTAGDVVAGVGFTIDAFNDSQLNEPVIASQDQLAQIAGSARGGGREGQRGGGQGTRLYGVWSVAYRYV